MTDYAREATAKIHECLLLASSHFGREFKADKITFDLKGRAAGKCLTRPGYAHIRINRVLLEKDPREIIDTTIPHEVAHLVQRNLYGVKVASHGREWRQIMTEVFKLEARRCNSMDVRVSASLDYVYRCSCREIFLGKRQHNSILRGRGMKCLTCQTRLVFDRHIDSAIERPAIDRLLIMSATKRSSEHLERVLKAVGKLQIKSLVVKAPVELGAAERYAKKLKAAEYELHTDQNTLPGNTSHAVIFASDQVDVSARAAKVLSGRGVKVRMLS